MSSQLQGFDGFWVGHMSQASAINLPILAKYPALESQPGTKRSHYVQGRYENTFIAPRMIPGVNPVLRQGEAFAAEILQREAATIETYFWFNAMSPGDTTGMHDHAGTEEVLSGVYYVHVPPDSGNLVLRTGGGEALVTPRAGMFVFFVTTMRHAVTINRSNAIRLSIGLNFAVSPAP